MPTRINKVIELLEQRQPVFSVGTHSGTELTYDGGKRLSRRRRSLAKGLANDLGAAPTHRCLLLPFFLVRSIGRLHSWFRP